MTDKEKFEGYKEKMLRENEENFGEEIRKKYGEAVVAASHRKFKNMTLEQGKEVEELSHKLNHLLREAFEQGNPAGKTAQEACALHKKWLGYFWDSYSKEAHKGLAQMYVDDPRFAKYYDIIAPGCARFLRDAILIFCQ